MAKNSRLVVPIESHILQSWHEKARKMYGVDLSEHARNVLANSFEARPGLVIKIEDISLQFKEILFKELNDGNSKD